MYLQTINLLPRLSNSTQCSSLETVKSCALLSVPSILYQKWTPVNFPFSKYPLWSSLPDLKKSLSKLHNTPLSYSRIPAIEPSVKYILEIPCGFPRLIGIYSNNSPPG